MKTVLMPLLETLIDVLRSRASLHLEMLAMRQQLAMVADGDRKRLSFRRSERIFWVWLYRLWPACLQTLEIFKPDTLVRWHRRGFRLYWTWKSRRSQGGRPAIDPDVLELIRASSATLQACLDESLQITSKLPSGYQRDVQRLKAPLFRGIDLAVESVDIMAHNQDGMTFVAKNITLDPGIHAAEEANRLVRDEGIPFREAYQRIAERFTK